MTSNLNKQKTAVNAWIFFIFFVKKITLKSEQKSEIYLVSKPLNSFWKGLSLFIRHGLKKSSIMKCLINQNFKNLKSIGNCTRTVSSLSPLGSAFNSRPQKSSFFPRQSWTGHSQEKTGLFQFPELTRPEGFHDLKVQCAQKSQELVKEACSAPHSQRKRIGNAQHRHLIWFWIFQGKFKQ